MVASLQGSAGMGIKEDESSTGRVWAAGFHLVMAHFCLARVLKLMNCLTKFYLYQRMHLFLSYTKIT